MNEKDFISIIGNNNELIITEQIDSIDIPEGCKLLNIFYLLFSFLLLSWVAFSNFSFQILQSSKVKFLYTLIDHNCYQLFLYFLIEIWN